MDVFVGEGEIFLPDCQKLKQIADEQKAQLNLHSYPKMQHVFVVHPIAEAKKAQNK